MSSSVLNIRFYKTFQLQLQIIPTTTNNHYHNQQHFLLTTFAKNSSQHVRTTFPSNYYSQPHSKHVSKPIKTLQSILPPRRPELGGPGLRISRCRSKVAPAMMSVAGSRTVRGGFTHPKVGPASSVPSGMKYRNNLVSNKIRTCCSRSDTASTSI